MFGIFVTMLVGGILGYAFRANVAQSMRTRMYSSLSEYGINRMVTDAWDFTQSRVSKQQWAVSFESRSAVLSLNNPRVWLFVLLFMNTPFVVLFKF